MAIASIGQNKISFVLIAPGNSTPPCCKNTLITLVFHYMKTTPIIMYITNLIGFPLKADESKDKGRIKANVAQLVMKHGV